jgi:hypothetical protein
MASKSLQTRLEQKARFEKQSEVRTGLLKEKGLNEKDITKDHEIKHFRARIKQINGAIARISFLEDQTKQLLERKEQRKIEAEQAKAEGVTGRSKAKAKAAAQAKAEAPKKKGAAGGKAPAKGKAEPKKKSK